MVAATGNMMLHCGGKNISFDDLQAVELPPETETYVPIAHADLALNITSVCSDMLHDYEKVDDIFAVSAGLIKNGEEKIKHDAARFFGLTTYRRKGGDKGEMGLALGYRNSYDKSMKIGMAIGARVFICDNMAISGSVASFSMLHTGDVLNRLRDEIVLGVNKSRDGFLQVEKDAEEMKTVRVADDSAFRMLGLAFGRDALTPTQLTNAVRSWKSDDYMGGFGEERTAWSLYNAGTEALKGVRPAKVMEKHVDWHKLTMQAVRGGDLQFADETGLTGDDLLKARVQNTN
jgi:hypothetical protein